MKGVLEIILITIVLTASVAYAGFGEIGGVLNFSLYPNSSQTLQWGLINDGNQTLAFTIMSQTSQLQIKAQNNLSVNVTPNITFYSSSWNISAGGTKYVNVTVSSQGLKVGQSWHGMIQALTAPSGSSSSGANIQLGTVKRFNITIVQTTTTTSTSTTSTLTTTIPQIIVQPSVPSEALIAVLVIVIVVIVIYYLLKKRKKTAKSGERIKKTAKK